MKTLINKARYTMLRTGGIIPKYQKGTGNGGVRPVPGYFKSYGMDGNKFISMFNALRTRGLSNQVSFEVTWQAMKENPKKFYSFGSFFKDVDSWADNVVNHQLKRNIYKNAVNAKNFDEYRKATLPYNRGAGYTDWLKTGRDSGKQFMNQYIQDNNLGSPIVMNMNNETSEFDNYQA